MRLVDKDGREGDDYQEAMYSNYNSLSSQGKSAFSDSYKATSAAGTILLGGTVVAANYGMATGGYIAANAHRINTIANSVIDFFTPGPRGNSFNSPSNVKGLSVGDLQRINVAGEVKLGLKTALDASKPLSQGGAGMQGIKLQGNGKLITLMEAGSDKIKVIIKKMVDGEFTSTTTSVGKASDLGIKNASELIKKGAGYNSHFIGDVK